MLFPKTVCDLDVTGSLILRHTLLVKNILPSDEDTVGRAIFEDNIELLQQLLAVHPDEGKEQILDVRYFLPSN